MMGQIQDNFPVSLTFDIDWAPDFVLQYCVEKLRKARVPATFFATHATPLLDEIKADPQFEVGVHPNFLPGTSHGQTLHEIMDFVLALVPNAQSLRTHGLYQTSNFYFGLMRDYPQLQYDFSLYLTDNPSMQPYKFRDEAGHHIVRVPYQWEDDLYFPVQDSFGKRSIIYEKATYQIFDFHPIHVFLNSPDSSAYNRMKTGLNKSLALAQAQEVEVFKYVGDGAETWLDHILNTVSHDRFYKACDLVSFLMKDQ